MTASEYRIRLASRWKSCASAASMPRWWSWTWACVHARIRGPLEGARSPVLVGEVEHLLTRLGHDGGEDRVDGLARLDDDSAAQTEDRVEHGAGGVRQRTSVDDGGRRADRAAAAEEAGPVGLELDDPVAVVLDGRQVRRPDPLSSVERGRRVASRASVSASNSVWTNRFWNAGWATSAACGASTSSRYDVSSSSRVARTEIGERDAPDLGVVLGDTVIVSAGRDRSVAPRELGLVLAVRHLVGVRLSSRRAGIRPTRRVRVGVAHVQEAAPRIARDVLRQRVTAPDLATGCSRIRRS